MGTPEPMIWYVYFVLAAATVAATMFMVWRSIWKASFTAPGGGIHAS